MNEIVSCPSCQRQLQIPENFFGQTVQCPDCRHQFVASPPASAVQSSPPPSSAPPKPAASGWDKASDTRDDDREYGRRRFQDDDDEFGDMRLSRRREHLAPHRATLVLIMGILAICCVAPIITGTIAWILGNSDLKEMDAGRMDPSGRGQTQTGKTLGMVGVIINVVLILGYCFIMIIAGAGGALNQPRRRR